MNTTSLRFRATTTLAAAITTFAAFAGSIALPSMAHAASDEPWPEPPSCSNETGTCTSIEDMVAYECYFEIDNSPFHFCDDPLAGSPAGASGAERVGSDKGADVWPGSGSECAPVVRLREGTRARPLDAFQARAVMSVARSEWSARNRQSDLPTSSKCSTTGGCAKNGPTMARHCGNSGPPRKCTVWSSSVSQKICST